MKQSSSGYNSRLYHNGKYNTAGPTISEFSTSVLTFHQLDECLKDQFANFHTAISHSASDLNAPPENRDLDRLNRFLNKLRGPQQLQQAIDLVLTTRFANVRNRCRDFYMNTFLRPTERSGINPTRSTPNVSVKKSQEYTETDQMNLNPYLDLVFSGFHQVFPAFEEEDQVELLDALSTLLVTESEKQKNKGLYESVIKMCTNTVKKCIEINFRRDYLVSFVKSTLQNSIKIAATLCSVEKDNKITASYLLPFLPFIAELEDLLSPSSHNQSSNLENQTSIFNSVNANIDQDLVRLVHQYMITCVLFTINDPKVFTNWEEPLNRISRFLPTLLTRKPKIDFSSTRARIRELLDLLKCKSFQKTEDLIPTFTNLLPNIPTKQILSLDLPDAVYALSIYFTETIRAERGIFGPVLEYIEVEYTPSFTLLLDSMIESILKTFYYYLGEIPDMERKTNCAAFTMKELLNRFCSPNERLQVRIDPILRDFIKIYPSVICDLQVLEAISNNLGKEDELSTHHTEHRYEEMKKIVGNLLQDALEFAPDLLCGSIFHSQIKARPYFQSTSNNNQRIKPSAVASSFSLTPATPFSTTFLFDDDNNDYSNQHLRTSNEFIKLVELLPHKYRAKFLNEFIEKSIALGQAQFVEDESTIRSIADYKQRVLLTASYIILHPYPESPLIKDLVDFNGMNSDVLMLAWAHISSHSVEQSKVLVRYLLQAFKDTIQNGQGIFASGKEDTLHLGDPHLHYHSHNPIYAESYKTMDAINFQTVMLRFFTQHLIVAQHYSGFQAILIPAMNARLLNHSAILPALLPLAYLGCLLLDTPYPTSKHFTYDLKSWIMKLVLISYSYIYDDYVLQYITPIELKYIENIATLLPSTLLKEVNNIDLPTSDNSQGKGNKAHKSTAKSHKQNTKTMNSISINLSTSARTSNTHGKIDSSILTSVQKSQMNYIEKKGLMNDRAIFESFVDLVTFLLCDQLQLFTMYINSSQTSFNPNLQRFITLKQMKPSKMHLNKTVRYIWSLAPEVLYPFSLMPVKSIGQNVLNVVLHLTEQDMFTAPSVPLLSLLYVQQSQFNPRPLAIWKSMPGNKALSLLDPTLMKDEIAASYVAKCFQLFSKRESLLFLPQLVQSLRFDQCKVLRNFLIKYCKTSEVFTHYLLWNILAEKNNPVGKNDNLPQILVDLEKQIISNMNPEEKKNYEDEFGLIDKLDEVSQKLLPMDIDKRPPALVDMLKEIELPPGLYIPSNPNYKIISIDAERSVPLKSHARVPILVNFTVYDEDAEKEEEANEAQPQQPNQSSSSDNEEPQQTSDASESDASDDEEAKPKRKVSKNSDDDSDESDQKTKKKNSDSDSSDSDESDKKPTKKKNSDDDSDISEVEEESEKEKKKSKKSRKSTKSEKPAKSEKSTKSEKPTKKTVLQEPTPSTTPQPVARKHKPILFSCIFKIHDDVRQDAMMIQFIDMTKQILTDAGIDHYLFPYRVFTTGTNRGVIECIQHAKSRHDLGVATGEDLLTYFINKYGQVGSPEFQIAQNNFIKSVAPYSLICYLFQVKDRHNANIMLDDDGHIIHIDFGFIFEISPGGNMKFEKSPFKLTKEMIDVMGGSKEAPAFRRFAKLLNQCFFAVRARHQELEAITKLMMNAGFPCFLSDSIKKLQQRFFLEKSAKETAIEISRLIDQAYEASSTVMYDAFQKAQNDIFF